MPINKRKKSSSEPIKPIDTNLRKPRTSRGKFDLSKLDPNFLEECRVFFASDEYKASCENADRHMKLNEIYRLAPEFSFEYKGYVCNIVHTEEGFWGIATKGPYEGVRREEPNHSLEAEIDALKVIVDELMSLVPVEPH